VRASALCRGNGRYGEGRPTARGQLETRGHLQLVECTNDLQCGARLLPFASGRHGSGPVLSVESSVIDPQPAAAGHLQALDAFVWAPLSSHSYWFTARPDEMKSVLPPNR
jgi:hypothetical protein